MKEALLEVRNLRKYFPIYSGILRQKTADVKAVDGIDFAIYPGDVVGMVGESGSGKSTAGRVAIRLIEPTSGEISFLGQNLLAFNKQQLKDVRRNFQMVFQSPYASLNPRKTVGDAIGEALLYHGLVKNRNEQMDRVAETLTLVGLSPDMIRRYPHQFSGGQQQRICIGRAIAIEPKLIVCDEAVSALDVSVQAQVLNLLAELKQKMGLSYLFISHDLSVIRHLCDRVVVLYLGKVMESASTEELFKNPKHPYTQALLSAIPISYPGEVKNRIMLKGEIPSSINPPSGCPFRTRCPYAQPICSLTPPKKEIFDPQTGKSDHVYHCILD
ncbi:MAG: peptide ABC transporter ATP-binding protein [Parachlamydia sp.]|nr:MAG: peptide ABC transporter ATP-binding protein [Parachlamydia sp.]